MDGGIVQNSKNPLPLCVYLSSVVSLQLYSSLDNEPTCLIESACINQLGRGTLPLVSAVC